MSEISTESNSKKLDHLIYLLEGEPGAPGVLQRILAIEEQLLGKEGRGGLIMKVNSMWRAHVWLLCTLSAGTGAVLTELLRQILSKKP